uniref:Uncharacterized protein n=1 Tax=Meteorus pulchricornis TaxID=51522 RepID=H7CHK8_9HYME|nr:hypothetical protein [Meteorus pulchricornis]
MLAYYFVAIFVVGPLILTTEVVGQTSSTAIPDDKIESMIDELTGTYASDLTAVKQVLKDFLLKIENDRLNITKLHEASKKALNELANAEVLSNNLIKPVKEALVDATIAKGQGSNAMASGINAEVLAADVAASAKAAEDRARTAYERSSGVTTSPYTYLHLFICVYFYLYI